MRITSNTLHSLWYSPMIWCHIFPYYPNMLLFLLRLTETLHVIIIFLMNWHLNIVQHRYDLIKLWNMNSFWDSNSIQPLLHCLLRKSQYFFSWTLECCSYSSFPKNLIYNASQWVADYLEYHGLDHQIFIFSYGYHGPFLTFCFCVWGNEFYDEHEIISWTIVEIDW